MYKIFFLLTFGAIIFTLVCTNCSDISHKQLSGYYYLNWKDYLQMVSLGSKARNYDEVALSNIHVSITETGSRFVTANYGNLFLFDIKKGEVCLLKPYFKFFKANVSLKSDLKKPFYNPVGVFSDDNNLYVANYKGNNILLGKIDETNCKIEFYKEYASEFTKGPENLVIDKYSDTLLSANYDSGTVTAFHLNTGTPKWTAKIGQAHGISISDGKVYVTGLFDRKVFELSLSDGKILRSIGSLGWNPIKNEFLWPTTIFPFGKNELVVTDPQTGFISFIDKNTFKVNRYTGGNGPGKYRFNYPYAAVPFRDSLMVLSSMRGEILELNEAGTDVIKRYALRKNIWPQNLDSVDPFDKKWNGYTNYGVTLKIFEKQYRYGFGHLHPVGEGFVFRVPDSDTLFNTSAYLYFLQGGKISTNLSFFFSSSSTTMLGLYKSQGSPVLLITTQIPGDSWSVNDQIVSSNGEVRAAKDIEKIFSQKASLFYDHLQRYGWISKDKLFQFFDSFHADRGFNNFLKNLDLVFVSSQGRKFKIFYDKCSENMCDIKELKDAAKTYYSTISFYAQSVPSINLDEYIIVGMLAGVSFNGL